MRRDLTSFVLRVLAYAVPVLALAPLGAIWLFEHHHWLPFGLLSAAIIGVLLIASRLLARPPVRPAATPPPAETWPDAGNAAWKEVNRIAARVAAAPPPFGDIPAYQNLGMEVIDTVGRHFYPTSRNPRLELTLVQTLEISQRVLRDIRSEVIDAIPGGGNVKLAHLDFARRAAAYVPAAVSASRIASLANRIRRGIFNLPVAAAYEVANLFDMSPSAILSRQANRVAADVFVQRVGKYAIQAFSDQSSLDTAMIQQIAKEQPLRILLLGPLNAGKSSLKNAMFGQERSKRDILPCPSLKEEQILDREGVPRAIILDSDGFGGTGDVAARKWLFEAIESIDLIIAVTSARQAARQLECQTLNEVRTRFANSTRRTCPPIIVAVTHIDLLQPAREWNPPYDFLDGESRKEQSVRRAVDAIATDFQVQLDHVIPVSLIPGAEYNVEESLLPNLGVALPEADRAKFFRVVDAHRSAESRDRVTRSIALLINAGTAFVNAATRQLK